MRSAFLLAACLVLAACDDMDATDGTRGSCAAGGVLSGCPDSPLTIEGACWRLVECGSYPFDGVDPGDRDYGQCLDRLASFTPERIDLVLACVASSTCDELLAPGSPTPYADPRCFYYGDR